MDLYEVFSHTEPITFDFMGHQIELEVYVAGMKRLTQEQKKPLEEVYTDEHTGVDVIRRTIPYFVTKWNLTWKGEPLPVTAESLEPQGDEPAKVPDALLSAMYENARRLWEEENPTQDASASGSEAPEPPLTPTES